MSKLQNIVVIGGGYSGILTGKELATKLDTTKYRLIVISPRKTLVHWIAMVRTTVTAEGELERNAIFPLTDGFLQGKGEFKFGKVSGFTSEEGGNGGGVVTLEGGEKIDYSILVLATGSQWSGPLAFPDEDQATLDHINSWRAKFKQANDIVLVGGGSIGLELAGELKDFYPSKNVTIVHSDKYLLNSAYPDRWRKSMLSSVEYTQTNVILSDRVEQLTPSEDGTVTTKNGKKIKADLIVPTWGAKPNTTIVRDSLGSTSITASGHVKVKPTLQLAAHPRIFAVGDIIDWKEQKQAGKIPAHVAVVVANVLALLNGQDTTTQYKGSPEMILVTLGRSGGSAYLDILWGIILGAWFARMMKSKSLLIDRIRQQYGFTA